MTSLAIDGGKWTQTGFSGTPIDAWQTMLVTVSGTYAKQGILNRHHITKEFHCSWLVKSTIEIEKERNSSEFRSFH